MILGTSLHLVELNFIRSGPNLIMVTLTEQFTILTRNFQNMIKGPLDFLGAFLNLVQLTHLVRTYMIMVNYKIPL